ncbi:MAG: hypothetical protein LBU81_06345 [Methanosarcinales archaeon]|jgi:hypothetical protein|nr:hypothetical protein [Methanosarcinales archaeon]
MAFSAKSVIEKQNQASAHRTGKSGWTYFEENMSKIRKFVMEDTKNDYVIIVAGEEGTGKSHLACRVCKSIDKDFNISESFIADFNKSEHSFGNFLKKFHDTKFKVAWYDEAVSILFSQTHTSRDSKKAQELFKEKRFCQHFDILVAPSFWDLVPDIRERRARILLYTYVEIKKPAPGRTEYVHKFAWFSRRKILQLSLSQSKMKKMFSSPEELFRHVRPNFTGTFPPMSSDEEAEYMPLKRDLFLNTVSEAFDAKLGKDVEIVESLDFSKFDSTYLEKKPETEIEV